MGAFTEHSPGEITQLLGRIQAGDEGARSKLIDVVYAELRRLAAFYMQHERRDHTLQPTAVVHEAYLRLIAKGETAFQNRVHFFANASTVMRRVLVDHARANVAAKRGGGQAKIGLNENFAHQQQSEELLVLDAALERLSTFDWRQSRIVELRFFGGLTEDETADVLGISARTVKRDWQFAKAWLFTEMKR